MIFGLLFYNKIEKSGPPLKKKWKLPKITIYLNLQNIDELQKKNFLRNITKWFSDTLSGKIFVGKKFNHFWKIRHFSPANFSNSPFFSDQILKLKGFSWVGVLFFQRKVVLSACDFSNWVRISALLVSLIHRIGCCKYTPRWMSQNKMFLYKLIFRDYKISEEYLRNFSHTFFYFYLIIIIHFTIMKWYNI